MSAERLLEASNIHKSFYIPHRVHLLRGVNLTVNRGDTVAITGRSGQGKSTLLNLLGTLEDPCEGSLVISSEKVTRFNRSRIRNKKIGFVFQSFHLLEDYTAIDNILMPARIARQDVSRGSPKYEEALALLAHVGLAERADFNTKLLSGGEKQRVAIARALCNNPEILFADEPSGNLDKQTSRAIHELLIGYVQNNNKALVVVTHDPELAQLCSLRYELDEGILLPKA